MRIDPALWQELERWAADDLRSVNGQIEFILREALRRRGVGRAPERQTDSPAVEGDASGEGGTP